MAAELGIGKTRNTRRRKVPDWVEVAEYSFGAALEIAKGEGNRGGAAKDRAKVITAQKFYGNSGTESDTTGSSSVEQAQARYRECLATMAEDAENPVRRRKSPVKR